MSLSLLLAAAAPAAPSKEPWKRWNQHRADDRRAIDHSEFADFLRSYVVASEDGIHRVRYNAAARGKGREQLDRYLSRLQATQISTFNRQQQMAFWINLYNALTIQVILEHLPVDSIRDIDISSGWFSNGPWDAELATVEGEKMSLNDIEHRILRPIWDDSRIHYAVNCASLGCPNLALQPFTAEALEEMLDEAAQAFVNHPRGARFEGDDLWVSSIFVWYQEDFGNSDEGVVQHLLRYARGDLARRLADYRGGLDHDYGWDLNATP